MNQKSPFLEEYWPETGSRVTFEPAENAKTDLPVTAVKLFAVKDNKLLMTKISKGWDIPGGHVEPGETPEQALVREIKEETGSVASNIQLVGYLRIENEKTSESSKYPRVSCILLYTGEVAKLGSKTLLSDYEAYDRKFVPFDQIQEYYHSWSPMQQQIFNYILGIK